REVLMAVLEILFENALQHGATRLEIRSSSDAASLTLDVQDNGTGISQNNRDKVFEPFFTTARDTGGTGLGLTIAQALLKSSRGTIELVSGKNPTIFRVSLPGIQ
ncbi:MAG: ATP-binding protein, partial [Pseudomonadales bacterium]|nr:ATP-binding protein [Pseudomonadales bacterium]